MHTSSPVTKFVVFHFHYPLARSTISLLASGLPLLAGALPAERVHAATTVPSSTSTVFLQLLDPASDTFLVPVRTVINNTGSSAGISGDNSKNWQLTNYGSVKAIGSGIVLGSTTPNSVQLDNFGVIQGITDGLATGVWLNNGGTLRNHLGASIGSDAFYGVLSFGVATVVNDGDISGASSGVRLGAGGSLTQSATGRLNGNISSPGLLIDTGAFAVNNAGSITSSGDLRYWCVAQATER
jgi:autotransporter family porin